MIDSLAYGVMILQKDFTSFCNHKLQKIGLSQGLLYFILYIGKHGGCSPNKLSKDLHLDGAHVTRSLTRLEQDDFIKIQSDPRDKRAHVLFLEQKGLEAFKLSHELFGDWDQQMMAGLSHEEQKMLLSTFMSFTKKIGGTYEL